MLHWIMDDPEGFYEASRIPFSTGKLHKAKLQSVLGFGSAKLAGRFAYLQQKHMREKAKYPVN